MESNKKIALAYATFATNTIKQNGMRIIQYAGQVEWRCICKAGFVNNGDVTTVKVTEEAILLLTEGLMHSNEAIERQVVNQIKDTIQRGVNISTLDMTASLSAANLHEFMQDLSTEFSKLTVIRTISHNNLLITTNNGVHTFFSCIRPSIDLSKETVLKIVLMAQSHRAEDVINRFCWNELFVYPFLDCKGHFFESSGKWIACVHYFDIETMTRENNRFMRYHFIQTNDGVWMIHRIVDHDWEFHYRAPCTVCSFIL